MSQEFNTWLAQEIDQQKKGMTKAEFKETFKEKIEAFKEQQQTNLDLRNQKKSLLRKLWSKGVIKKVAMTAGALVVGGLPLAGVVGLFSILDLAFETIDNKIDSYVEQKTRNIQLRKYLIQLREESEDPVFRDIIDGILDNKKRPMFTQEQLQEITENAEATPNTQNTPQFTKVPMASNYPMLMTFDPTLGGQGDIKTPQQEMRDIEIKTRLIEQQELNIQRLNKFRTQNLNYLGFAFPSLECTRATTLQNFLETEFNGFHMLVKNKFDLRVHVNGVPVHADFSNPINLNPGDKVAFQPRILGLKLEVGRIAEKINRMLEQKGKPYSDMSNIDEVYQHIIDYGFTESNRELIYEFLKEGISKDVPFRKKNWQNGEISPYTFLLMFFASEMIKIFKKIDSSFDWHKLCLILDYNIKRKIDDLRRGDRFGLSIGPTSFLFYIYGEIYNYIRKNVKNSVENDLLSDMDKLFYIISRAFNVRPRRDSIPYFLTERFLYSLGQIIIKNTESNPSFSEIRDKNNRLLFNKFLQFFGLTIYQQDIDRFDNLNCITIFQDKEDRISNSELENIASHRDKVKEILEKKFLHSLAKITDQMFDNFIEELKEKFKIQDRLDTYPDGKRKRFFQKILYSPFCPKIFKKIASDSLTNFVELIFNRRLSNFLESESIDKDFQFQTLSDILYDIMCLTPGFFTTFNGFSRNYDVSMKDIHEFQKVVENAIHWLSRREGYINVNHFSVTYRNRKFVSLQFNTIQRFIVSFKIYIDGLKRGKTQISASSLNKKIKTFRQFMALNNYISQPRGLPFIAINTMISYIHKFINYELNMHTPKSFLKYQIYEKTLVSLIDLREYKKRLMDDYDRKYLRLRGDSSNFISYLSYIFEESRVKVKGWENPNYVAFSNLMLNWETGGMGADGNSVEGMFLSNFYTQVRQHMVEDGSSDPRRDSLALNILVHIASLNHAIFGSIPPGQQKDIKEGLRNIFFRALSKDRPTLVMKGNNIWIAESDFAREFPHKRKFDITINGQDLKLSLRQIWDELNLEGISFKEKLFRWSEDIQTFKDALKNPKKNPYYALIEGTPLEKYYKEGKKFVRTLMAYKVLYEKKDQIIIDKLGKRIDFVGKLVDEWHIELFKRAFNLDNYNSNDYLIF